MKKSTKNPPNAPHAGDMVIVKPRDSNTADVQVTDAALLHSIANVFRDKLGKRDAQGREIDLHAASDEEVIKDVVANIDGIPRSDSVAMADALFRFWEDPMAFAARAMSKLAH